MSRRRDKYRYTTSADPPENWEWVTVVRVSGGKVCLDGICGPFPVRPEATHVAMDRDGALYDYMGRPSRNVTDGWWRSVAGSNARRITTLPTSPPTTWQTQLWRLQRNA